MTTDPPTELGPSGQPALVNLVHRARDGDANAWNQLVDRFAPLVWSVCRRHRLSDADAEDVCATVWLRLVERLDSIRTPEALPGWLATTTARECLTVLRQRKRQVPVDAGDFDRPAGGPELSAGLVADEELSALRLAFAELPERCRRLLALLFRDPPPAYAAVSASMDMPMGAIGPTRQRCLDRLRRSPFVIGVRAEPATGVGRR